MAIERREFMRMALAYSVAGVKLAAYPDAGFGQSGMTGLFGSLAMVEPKFFTSMMNFGLSVLPDLASGDFVTWAKSRVAIPSPHPQSFSDRFNPRVQINLNTASDAFTNQTKVTDRSLIVNTLPHIVATSNPTPSDHTSLNGPEMDELANKRNPLLWHEQCGCIVRIPLNSKVRRPPSSKEEQDFVHWAYSGGIVAPPKKQKDLKSRIDLDYVRDFCQCEGTLLRGFAYRDAHYQNKNRALFAITRAYT